MRDSTPSESGAGATFDSLVAQYEKPIFNVVYRILGDYDEAADVTQETFISAYKAFSRFRGESAVFTWLYQIALNHSRNRLRKRKRDEDRPETSLERHVDDSDGTRELELPDLRHAPHTALEQKEMQRKIQEAVAALPPEYREVVVLREMHGLSYNEIVEATGLTLDNVKTRLSRARAMLRRRLEPYVSGT